MGQAASSDDEFQGFGNLSNVGVEPSEPVEPAASDVEVEGGTPAIDDIDESETDAAAVDADEDKGDVSLPVHPTQASTADLERVIEVLPQYDDVIARIEAQARKFSEPISTDPLAYNTDAEYQAALARAAAQDMQLRQLYANYQEAEAAKGAARLHVWERQTEAGRSKYKDFDQVLAGGRIKPSAALAEIIVSSPRGADIAYHLSKDHALAERVSRMSPLAAAVEIGRMEARLSAPAKPVVKSVTKAPQPPPAVRAGGGVAAKTAANMSYADLSKSLYGSN